MAILLLAGLLRLRGIGFGLPALNDPDELMFELGAIRMLRNLSLNPGWFGHPATTTMYLLACTDAGVFAVGRALGWFSTIKSFGDAVYANPAWVILPGRVLMALFGVGTVWLTHRLTRRLFGEATALIAALLLAVSPVAISWAQVIRSDIMATFFMMLCLLSVLNLVRDGRRRDILWAALWLGMATATKWPFALAGLGMVGGVLLQVGRRDLSPWRAVLRLALFALLCVGALVLISPYIVLAHDTVARNLTGEAQAHHLGATGGTPLENAWWYVSDPLYRGLGPVALALAVPGLWGIWRNLEARALLLPILAAFAVVLCCQHLIWERWALPVLPFLAISVALAVVDWVDRLATGPLWARRKDWLVAAAAVGLALPLVWADVGQARARSNDTRQRAAAWAIGHIPSHATVMIEHFGFDLYAQPWQLVFPLGDAGCVDAKALLKGKVNYAAIEQGRGARANVDYGTMTPARRGTCAADYAILTQYDRYAAEHAAFPREYAAYREMLSHGVIVATFAPRQYDSAGPVVRIFRYNK